MKRVILQRYKEDLNQSTGVLTVLDEGGWPVFSAPCIERGDRNNEKGESNVLPGCYPLVLEHSPKFNTELYELKNTTGRSECKIHASNYWNQLNGCIAPGAYLTDLNKDGYQDVARSKNTLDAFMRAMDGDRISEIVIIDPIEL